MWLRSLYGLGVTSTQDMKVRRTESPWQARIFFLQAVQVGVSANMPPTPLIIVSGPAGCADALLNG